MGSPTIKTAKKMVESTTFRKVLYNSASKTGILDMTIILCCIFDSEMRWYLKEDFEYFNYDQFKSFQFYILNVLRLVQLSCVIASYKYTYIWYQMNIKKLKQRNKLS